MLKKDKVHFIINHLDKIYPEVSAPLKHSNHYTLLIAVLLSANTTDKSVNKAENSEDTIVSVFSKFISYVLV